LNLFRGKAMEVFDQDSLCMEHNTATWAVPNRFSRREEEAMGQLGVLQAIYRYPVKSMAGEELEKAFVSYGGIMGDRVFAFVRAKGIKGFPWHTGREQEEMVLFRPQFRDAGAMIEPQNLEASLALAVNPVFPPAEAFDVDVITPEGKVYAIQSTELEADLEQRSGERVSLRFSDRGLYDCRPISIFGNTSLNALGDELDMLVDRRRFRANFYVDWTDPQPYYEDTLVGRTLSIGDRLKIAVLERDPRCKMITIDPDTGKIDKRILHHVISAHDGAVGVYAAVLMEGTVWRGDAIWLE
jgi:MOSC domain-containing protein